MNNPLSKKPDSGGLIHDIVAKIRLTFSLMKDERVPVWLKALPVLGLIYLIAPLDMLFGPIDDAVVLYFAMDFFISLCPSALVSEYQSRMDGRSAPLQADDIVDVEIKRK